jgi:hypothetical protein
MTQNKAKQKKLNGTVLRRVDGLTQLESCLQSVQRHLDHCIEVQEVLRIILQNYAQSGCPR